MPGSRRPKKGKVKLSTVTPAETGIDDRDVWPSSFGAAGEVEDVVEEADQAIATAPIRIAWLSAVVGQPDQPGDEDAGEDRRGRPSFGVGDVCSERSLGKSIAPTRTREPLGQRHQQQRQDAGDEEGEERRRCGRVSRA